MPHDPARVAANPWMRHMRRGDFEAAWRISDAVLRARAGRPCAHLPRHLQYCWDGTPLAGRRILVRCYHGLGDTLQFIRYAPRLRAIAAEVTVWAQPELLSLLGTVAGIDRLLPLHDGTPDTAYDADVELMELPHVFRSTPASLPAAVPYLQVERPVRSGGRFDRRLAVGLVWRAGDWDPRRSIPFRLLAPLAAVPGVAWHIFQKGPGLEEWTAGFGVRIESEDLMETARAIRALDLMITVDTMTAHLAGALGVSVWTLLQRTADWRWMEGRADSPWYPTMRLFRQGHDGGWAPVIAQVAVELARLAARRAARAGPLGLCDDAPQSRTGR